MFIHEDERRKLIEWAGGKVSKALIAKDGCVVGDHYHQKKEERFLLLTGKAKRIVIGDWTVRGVLPPAEFIVPPNTYHLFELEAGSILLGTASEEFDPADEIKGRTRAAEG